MVLYKWNDLDSFSQSLFFSSGTAISIGSFDGLHLGHRFLLQNLVTQSDNKKLIPGLISFTRPLPAIKHSSDYSGDLSTLNQRLELFEEAGIQFVFLVDFNQEFASLKGTEFLSLLKEKCNMKFLAEGIDFRCGYKGATDVQAIRYWAEENNVECSFVDPIYYTEADGSSERVSSSFIRKMVLKGFFTRVGELLKRPYQLDIKTIKDSGCCNQVLPPDGIYHPLSEKALPLRLEIKNSALVNIPDCESLSFI